MCPIRRKIQYTLIYIICIFFTICGSIPCDSCGKECTTACGTKHFRTCCFNYLRKRSEIKAIKMISNKKLSDFFSLQGKATFSHNEMSSKRANILFTHFKNSTELSDNN